MKSKVNSSFEKTCPEYSSANYYSIKYLGVTNGQIGILSKRTKIPQLSPMETCKDVPLAVINGTVFGLEKEFSVKKMKKYSNESSPNKKESLEKGDFVVHNYARPRGLSTSYKKIRRGGLVTKVLARPIQTRAVSGWKLSRPRSNSPCKDRSRKDIEAPDRNDLMVYSSQVREKGEYAEPYLGYLTTGKRLKNV
jgi:hypothetical protein